MSATWAVTSKSGKKRIHRGDCRYAKSVYNWAGDRTERELFDALRSSGAIAWHDAGQCCCPDLDWAIHFALNSDSAADIDRQIAKLSTVAAGGVHQPDKEPNE